MHAEELPMIIFTVFAQMSVGAFWILGAIQMWGRLRKYSAETVDRVTDIALFAAGPLLVFGFIAASFHLNDPFNAINTMRHVGSSWLSREIISGVAFGALGAFFALCQWRRWFSRSIREILAILTALAGLALLVSMTGVYYFVRTIPTWHTPVLWVLFFGSALLSGALAVSIAIFLAWEISDNSHPRFSAVLRRFNLIRDVDDSADLVKFVRQALAGASVVSAIAGLAMMCAYPIQLLGWGTGPEAAQEVAAQLPTGWLIFRLVSLAMVIVITGILAYTWARSGTRNFKTMMVSLVLTWLLAVTSELIGRGLHYEGLHHVGLTTSQMLGG